LKDPIEKQLVAIRAEDVATAYSYTTKNFQKNTSLEDFTKFINEYSGLRNNESISYDNRSIDNGVGTVNAQLKSRSGSDTPVFYKLLKVNDQWRIETIVINPAQNAPATTSANTKSTPEKASLDKTPPKEIVLNNTFKDPKFKYVIQYPNDWQVNNEKKVIVIFRGKETSSAQSSFLIQGFKQGRKHQPVQAIMNEAKNAISKDTTDMKIIETGSMPPLNPDTKYEGQYAIYSYNINNKPVGHLEVIAYSALTRVLYVLDYVTPLAQFEKDLPIAKAMIVSFSIYK
jgi:hypothetical protein